jgi:hypothetical protein
MKLLSVLNEAINRKRLKEKLKEMGFEGEDIETELESLIDYIDNLPDTINLYRILSVDDESDINKNKLGSHYSTSKRDLKSSHSYVSEFGEKKFLVSVKAPKTLIDVQSTLENRILYPNEQEITLKNKGKGVEIISIKKI